MARTCGGAPIPPRRSPATVGYAVDHRHHPTTTTAAATAAAATASTHVHRKGRTRFRGRLQDQQEEKFCVEIASHVAFEL